MFKYDRGRRIWLSAAAQLTPTAPRLPLKLFRSEAGTAKDNPEAVLAKLAVMFEAKLRRNGKNRIDSVGPLGACPRIS